MAAARYSMVLKPWLKLRAACRRFSSAGGRRLAGLVVAGEALQHLRPRQPVLVELGGQLDEILLHAGARHARIGDVREQAVQAVAELVEQRARVVEAQQRRLARRALGEVHDVDHDRA